MSTDKKLPRSLPVAPLVPWITEMIERETIEALSRRVRISDRWFRHILAGRMQSADFDKIDQFITNEGSCNMVDFYPEYFDDDFLFDPKSAPKRERVREYPEAVRPKRVCSLSDCNRAMHAKGFCERHYRKAKRGVLVVA